MFFFCFTCSVKPAVFDLFLALGILGYLGIMYLIVQVCALIVDDYNYMFTNFQIMVHPDNIYFLLHPIPLF